MADGRASRAGAVEALVGELRGLRIGATFNQYGGDSGGARRRANLLAYLRERLDADVVAIGEAGGYRGARFSGIAFTSERDLARWGAPFRPSSARQGGWSEPSGTIVHSLLEELDAERRVALWNVVPTHPHRPGEPLSNRRPAAAEIAAGAPLAQRLIALLEPRLVVAVGRVAEAALGDCAVAVRHPSMGGAPAFRAAMRRLLAQ